MTKFQDRLAQDGILIADGATGTTLQKAGLPSGMAPERWNLENPDAIRALHRGYVEAGSDLILTNTFGGSRLRLEMKDLADRTHEINLAAARLAREVAGDEVLVLGDMGPTGQLMEPMGTLTYEAAVDVFAEQAAALAEGGADAILIETMSDLNEAKAAVEGARRATRLPIHRPLVTADKSDITARAREVGTYRDSTIPAGCNRIAPTYPETNATLEQVRDAEPDALFEWAREAAENCELVPVRERAEEATP